MLTVFNRQASSLVHGVKIHGNTDLESVNLGKFKLEPHFNASSLLCGSVIKACKDVCCNP